MEDSLMIAINKLSHKLDIYYIVISCEIVFFFIAGLFPPKKNS